MSNFLFNTCCTSWHTSSASWVEFRGTDNLNIRTLEAKHKQMTTATTPTASASASGAKWQRFNAWPQSDPPSSKLDLIPFGKYKGQTSANLLKDGAYVDWIMIAFSDAAKAATMTT